MGLLLIITGLRLAEKIVVLRRLHDLRKTIVQLYCNDYMPSYCGKVKISCGYQTYSTCFDVTGWIYRRHVIPLIAPLLCFWLILQLVWIVPAHLQRNNITSSKWCIKFHPVLLYQWHCVSPFYMLGLMSFNEWQTNNSNESKCLSTRDKEWIKKVCWFQHGLIWNSHRSV